MFTTGFVVLGAVLVSLRLYSASPLWLDEALSVDIAALSPQGIVDALAHDGSPPLYYLLLHYWIDVVGTGSTAVRALSTLCSLAMLPVAYGLGRRLAGARGGYATVLVVAASPFEIRYATEARMYALVGLLTLLGGWAVLRALERPTLRRLALVSGITGLLALTHYWTVFLAVAVEVALLCRAVLDRRQARRGAAARVAVAVPLGGLLFLPWLPTFLHQSAHTATPWSYAPRWVDLVDTVRGWSGTGPWGWAHLAVFLFLLGIGMRDRLGRTLLAVGLGSLTLGLAASIWAGSGYSLRYSSAAIAPVLLAAGLGLARLPRPALRRSVAAALAVAALGVAAFTPLLASRTEAGATAEAIGSQLGPDDLVVYCPDQLGPAVDRLLPAGTAQVAYPTMAAPTGIDWTDYAVRNASADPAAFARAVSAQTSGAVYLVGHDGYLTYGDQCSRLDAALTALRGAATDLQDPAGAGESAWVHRFASVSAS